MLNYYQFILMYSNLRKANIKLQITLGSPQYLRNIKFDLDI